MTDSGKLRFIVVGEDKLHDLIGRWAVDRLSARLFETAKADWVVLEDSREWLERHDVKARSKRLRTHGRSRGEALGGMNHLFRASLLALKEKHVEPPELIVILHDSDGSHEVVRRGVDLEHIQDIFSTSKVVCGIPHQEAEGWLFAQTELAPEVNERLKNAAQKLSFDPSKAPEKLNARGTPPLRSAKRVARYVLAEEGTMLTDTAPADRALETEDAERLVAHMCVVLAQQATFVACGLADFLERVQQNLPQVWSRHLPPVSPT